jgi:hypothetical protein
MKDPLEIYTTVVLVVLSIIDTVIVLQAPPIRPVCYVACGMDVKGAGPQQQVVR